MLDLLPNLLDLSLPLAAEGATGGAGDAIAPLFSVPSGVSLLTLGILEIVLGIDNVVFIAILTGKLPVAQRKKAWFIGLGLAMVMRILLLFAATFIMALDENPVFTLPTLCVYAEWAAAHPEALPITWKDIILLVGGLFLIGKATYEIHDKLEGGHGHGPGGGKPNASFGKIIVQIVLLDLVFSVDSVITAVGIADHLEIMIAAVVIAIGVMLVFAQPISGFVERHPSMKMLALAFLILIGVLLVADAFAVHVPRGYIYFAMAFSVIVEIVNIQVRKRKQKKTPVKLRQSYVDSESDDGYGDVAHPKSPA